MKTKKLLLLTAFLFTVFSAFSQKDGPIQKVIGGNQITIDKAPYAVSIWTWSSFPGTIPPGPGPKLRGSGYLISDKWVVVAAHTVKNLYNSTALGAVNGHNGTYELAGDMMVQFGSETLNGLSARFCTSLVVHPSFDPLVTNSDYDIALLELSQPISFNHDQYPIEFANTCNTQSSDYSTTNPLPITVAGFGKTYPTQPEPTTATPSTYRLHSGITELISDALANSTNLTYLPNATPVGSLEFGVLDPNNVVAPYSFDSGSPAVVDKNGNLIAIGTHAWSVKDPSNQVYIPGIYTDNINFMSFITQTTGITAPGNTLDLYTKDKPWDQAQEPFNVNHAWTSEDIWVRQTNDQVEINEPAEYKTTSPNYVYVRVTNNSCIASSGNELLKLYWAKAATNLTWPNHWNGSVTAGTQPLGGLVSTVTLPVIQPGDAYIAEIPWYPPNPNDFSALYNNYPSQFLANEKGHFCLLSRIETTSDPMTFTETSSVYANARNNNNIAWKNISVVNLNPNNITGGTNGNDRPVGATLLVGGMGNPEEDFDLEFCNAAHAGENNVFNLAEIKITLDDVLWEKWENEEFSATNIEILDPEKNQIMLTNTCGIIPNLTFDNYENAVLHASFNFLTEEVDGPQNLHFSIAQRNSSTEDLVGGEEFDIILPDRTMFYADAGDDEEINLGESTTLVAGSIGESAIYNWYDQNGSFLYSGSEYTVSPEALSTYKLEVIAESDGYKDYDEVVIEVKKNFIDNVSPNPADEYLNVYFEINEGEEAYFVMMNINSSVSSQYNINLGSTEQLLNTSELITGSYSLVLYVDGAPQDERIIIIE